MKSLVRTVVAPVLFSLAAWAAVPSASAAIVTGSWDPALPDPPFDNLGWTTTINLQIDDRCKQGAQSLPLILNLGGRSFGCDADPDEPTLPVSVLTAQIGLYDLTSMRIIDVLTFNPQTLTPELLDLDSDGSLTYLFSVSDSNAVRGNVEDRTKEFRFKLELLGQSPAISYRAVAVEEGEEEGEGERGFIRAPGLPTETAFEINPDSAMDDVLARTALKEGQLVFTAQPVPEPGSLALALLALGVAGAAASRRAKARA